MLSAPQIVKSIVSLVRQLGGMDVGGLPQATQTEIVRRQVSLVHRTMVPAVIVNVVILGLLGASLWGAVPTTQLLAWAAAVLTVVGAWLVLWRRSSPEAETSLERLAALGRRISMMAGMRGLIWGGGVIAFFPVVDPTRQLVIGLTAVGMMCGSAFGLALLPAASLSYAGAISASIAVALALSGGWAMHVLSALMLVFFYYLLTMVGTQNRLFVGQMAAELTSAEQRQTIAVLLREFEESSSDWLWQTDAEGCFINIGARFVESSGLSEARLTGMKFVDLFGHDPEFINVHARENLGRREPLSDLTVSVEVGGKRQYWALSGSPQWDSQKQFLGYRGVAADITGKVLADRRLRELAHRDQLTGLLNRARFLELLDQAFSELPLDEIGLVTIDLSGFKLINDTLGHTVGDALLVQFGRRMGEWAGRSRIVSRLGEDEFAVLLLGPEQVMGADRTASELLALFELPFEAPPHDLLLDACAGIALAGAQSANPADLMKCADLALHAAQADGRGHQRRFEPAMGGLLMRRQQLERALRQAIELDELSLRYQPIIGVKSGQVAAYEALLRWNSRELGMVSPAEFIPIAEACGLIVPIGDWVLRTATAEAATWPGDVQVCINVSPAQLRNSRLFKTVCQCLEQSGLPAHRLTVEITEGVLMEASDHVAETLRDFLELGIEIALDDFGTGYSSLSYLRSFPFSKLKIDKSFIDALESDAANIQIVKAIVDLAGALGFEVVAEGVETHLQLARLTSLHCDYVQGYLFAAPQLPDELAILESRGGPAAVHPLAV